jgi:hypothetical protein
MGALQLAEAPRIIPAVVTLGYAIDLYIAHLARLGRSKATRKTYRLLLNDFASVTRDKEPSALELTDYERFLDRAGRTPAPRRSLAA